MKLEIKTGLRIVWLYLSAFIFGVLMTHSFNYVDDLALHFSWIGIAFGFVLISFIGIRGIDDDLRLFYKKYPKKVVKR